MGVKTSPKILGEGHVIVFPGTGELVMYPLRLAGPFSQSLGDGELKSDESLQLVKDSAELSQAKCKVTTFELSISLHFSAYFSTI